jgi:hypothetical protein
METLEQVKQAAKDGNQVNWQGGAYTVIIGKDEQFMIKHSGGNCVGLRMSTSKAISLSQSPTKRCALNT